jgi:septin family protein
MPPHGPSQLDLALMAGLSKHVALLPVIGKADAMTAQEARECCRAVQHMLAEPYAYAPSIPGGACINVYA